MDIVQSILSGENSTKFKTTEVLKDIDVEIDEGNLLAIDPNPLVVKDLRSNKESFLTNLARDNTQLLINKIWQLPVEKVDDIVTAKLPDPKTLLPREKPIPKAKQATKWEEYAKTKGIENKKKSRMVWDDQSQEWKPRWGFKRANDDTKDWVIEVPDHGDPYEDQFAKRIQAKKERVAKNELQRLRNIARTMKGKVPGVGLTPTENPDKDHVTRALHVAKTSTASVGKFTKTLAKEKPARNLGAKRKFEPNFGDTNNEKRRALDILNKVQNKKPVIDVSKAANRAIYEEESQRRREKASSGDRKGKAKSKGKKGKGASRTKTFSTKKGKLKGQGKQGTQGKGKKGRG